jgi:predicted AlkP superfamily pyrophosphatase or phosphodiesterase
MRKLRWLILGFTLLAACASCQSAGDNYTVIISLDGNRWDYPQYYNTEFFDSLATVGVSARMEPSFPASTFPNHYTLATGLVPDHHGLVNNSFWDPGREYSYSMSDPACRYDPYYYGGEPIWITAQRQGVKTGNVYWVGSDIPIKDEYPTYYRNWDEDPHWDFEERVDEIVRLLSLPESERPRLVMGYFDEPDHTGHVYGPISPETKDMVEHMDSLMHGLYLRLKALPYGDRINFIVLSDHGMEDISPERFVSWHAEIPEGWAEKVMATSPTSIFVKEGYVDSLYNRLSKIEHLSVWKHGEVPGELNYGTSGRLGDLIVAPDLGWQFASSPSKNNGAHGYSPKEPDMMVMFRAVGPDFKEGYEAPFTEGEQSAFRNVDIYPLLCKLLGIKPAATDGNLERIVNILK